MGLGKLTRNILKAVIMWILYLRGILFDDVEGYKGLITIKDFNPVLT